LAVTGDVQDVAFSGHPRQQPQFAAAAKLVVAGHPSVGQLPAATLQQVQGDAPAFLESDILGNVGLVAMGGVSNPLSRQVETCLDEGFAA
jgi:hypothetical protein